MARQTRGQDYGRDDYDPYEMSEERPRRSTSRSGSASPRRTDDYARGGADTRRSGSYERASASADGYGYGYGSDRGARSDEAASRDARGYSRRSYDREDQREPERGRGSSSARPSSQTRPESRRNVSTRRPAARGVNPVTRASVRGGAPIGYGQSVYDQVGTTRRGFIKGAGIALGVTAVLGVAGFTWWTHRAVQCTVNGSMRMVPLGTSAKSLVNSGYAKPKNGDLVSIKNTNGEVTVLEQGGGKPYTITVNGEARDVDTYGVDENDAVEFHDGENVTEQVINQQTDLPCSYQITPDGEFLVSIGYVAQWGRNGKTLVETGVRSGYVVDHGVAEEPQDFIVTHQGINPDDGRHLIALTFDDGPDPTYTPQYLDILARYGVKATFFNLGSEVVQYPDLARRIVEEGHQISSHTYSHANLLELSPEGVRDEVVSAFDAIEQATGFRPASIRAPYGNIYGDDLTRLVGMVTYTAYWSVDSLDWDYATRTGLYDGADAIVQTCTYMLGPDNYNGAVVLMHDGGGDRSRDVIALPTLIETYMNAGYQLVTLNEMIASDSTYPAWVSSENPSIPEGAYVPTV